MRGLASQLSSQPVGLVIYEASQPHKQPFFLDARAVAWPAPMAPKWDPKWDPKIGPNMGSKKELVFDLKMIHGTTNHNSDLFVFK